MRDVIKLNIGQFLLIYLLLIVVVAIMRRSRVDQTKLLVVASLRMTVQLILAGVLLSYIFQNPHPVFTLAYLAAMVAFALYRTLSKNPWLNRRFKAAVGASIALSGLFTIGYFVILVVGTDFFDPQYTITIGGMVIGNAMTGVTLGLKTFHDRIQDQRPRIEALLDVGVEPKRILLPLVNSSLESALLPTLNNMLGMGIISLPGMMTGQILAGTFPMTAIFYQIAIMIAICTAVCLTTFCTLHFGYQTLYNKRNQISFENPTK